MKNQRKLSFTEKLPPIPLTPETQKNNEISLSSNNNITSSAHHTHTQPSDTSFDVCESCHKMLLDSYNHCLHKNISYDNPIGLPSLQDFDEQELQISTSPPVLRVLKDPTSKVEFFDALAGARPTAHGMANLSHHSRTPPLLNKNNVNKLMIVGSSHDNVHTEECSGDTMNHSTYMKAVLQKDKEIAHLKQQLYEKNLVEKIEHSNIEKMQKVLGKAVKFYALADDWKNLETKQLQDKIVGLKTYVGSLMSYILKNDDHSRKLDDRINIMAAKLAKSDAMKSKNDDIILELKEKLSDSFKEYVELNDEFEILKKNSVSIEEHAATRKLIETMSQQYQSISKDLVHVTKNFEDKTMKLRQLEFECEEMVKQFNDLGKSNADLEENYGKIVTDQANLESDYSKLRAEYNLIFKQRDMLQYELGCLQKDHSQLQLKSTNEKNERDIQINNQKAEIQVLQDAKEILIEELNESKNVISTHAAKLAELEELLNLTNNVMSREIQERDSLSLDLKTKEANAAIERDSLLSKNGELITKFNELHQTIDEEANKKRVLMLELEELRTTFGQSMASFQEESQKLNQQKDALIIAKITQAEELREVKNRLEYTVFAMDQLTKDHAIDITMWESRTEQLSADRAAVERELSDLQSKHKSQNTILESVNVNIERLTAIKEELTTNLHSKNETYETLSHDNNQLSNLLQNTVKERDDYLYKLNSKINELEEVNIKLSSTSSELDTITLESQSTIKNLNTIIPELEEQIERQKKIILDKDEEIMKLTQEFKILNLSVSDLSERYEDERALRELVQAILDRKVQELIEEKLKIDDAQKMLFQINIQNKNAKVQQDAALLNKQKRLAKITSTLKDESEKLSQFLGFLPESTGAFEK